MPSKKLIIDTEPAGQPHWLSKPKRKVSARSAKIIARIDPAKLQAKALANAKAKAAGKVSENSDSSQSRPD